MTSTRRTTRARQAAQLVMADPDSCRRHWQEVYNSALIQAEAARSTPPKNDYDRKYLAKAAARHDAEAAAAKLALDRLDAGLPAPIL